MPLIVDGSAEDRVRVQTWLSRICADVDVDVFTGEVTVDPSNANTNIISNVRTGCDCLRELIAGGPSRRTTTIHLLDGAHQRVPKHGQPATDKDPPIQQQGGGATVPWDSGAYADDKGNPGVGTDGQVGSNVDVYIDNSDNARNGYDYQAKETNKKIPCPQWIILAHELTTGHASWCIKGLEISANSKGVTAANWQALLENRAIQSEQPHRAAWKLEKRPLNPVPE